MQYVFQINTLDQKTLLPQLSQALQKRTELLSRQKYPSLWHKHDYITAQQKMPPDVLLQRRRRYRIYGIILLLLHLQPTAYLQQRYLRSLGRLWQSKNYFHKNQANFGLSPHCDLCLPVI